MSTVQAHTSDRETWLAERRKGIGGSDAAAAAGLSKWKTPLQLWYEKRGESSTIESEAMKWGTRLEPLIRDEYQSVTHREVCRPTQIIRCDQYPFAIANIDGVTVDDRLFEAKTARTAEGWGEPGSDEVPIDYYLQVQHYMAVTSLPVADIAVLIGASDFRIYTVDSDREIQDSLMAAEASFWRMVESEIPPPPKSSAECSLRWAKSLIGVSVQASAESALLVAQLKARKQALKEHEQAIDELETQLKSIIADAEALVDGKGNPLITWKSTKPRVTFDAKSFERDYPELFIQYNREGKPSRMFLVK